MENSEFRAFWAVIPATVLDDMELPANAKILYGVLSSLMRREGYCWATNAQLAEAMHCSEDVIMRWISSLSKGGHIRVKTEPNRKTGGKIRYIFPALQEPKLGQETADGETGYMDKNPGTYMDKNPGVHGQTSSSPYIDKNKNKKKKEKENAPAAAVAASLFVKCDAYGMEVAQAMQRFLSMRQEIGKPVKSEQAAKMLWNKLVKLSNSNAAHMTALLNTATERQWLSLYQLKPDEMPQQTRREVDTGGVRFL